MRVEREKTRETGREGKGREGRGQKKKNAAKLHLVNSE